MKRPKKVDSLIVGGGLIGLKLLKKLESSNEKVFLIEKTGDIGGTTTTIDEETRKAKLNTLIWLTDQNKNTETFTLGKKGVTPFLGFGDYKGNVLDVAESFTNTNSVPLESIDTELGIEIGENEPMKTLTQATKLIIDQDGQNFCELNGKDSIEFNTLYWTAPMDELLKLMPKESLNELKQKASKAKKFDGMTMQFDGDLDQFKDYQHAKFILFGEDDTPWMGSILEGQVLTFSTFYSYTLSQDHDFIRRHMKSLKRQVRKIFPNLYTEDQISMFSTDRLTLHSDVLSLLSLSTKTIKELKPIVFCGSHKAHFPSPFESKNDMISNIQNQSPKANSEPSSEEPDSEDPELALANPL